MKLISMTAFVLERSLADISEYTIIEAFKNGAKVMNEIFTYAKFLKQPLTLGMFVPCDDDGNVLKEPLDIEFYEGDTYYLDYKIYKEAQSKVLFKDFSFINQVLINNKNHCSINKYDLNRLSIESLTIYNLDLTVSF